MVAKITLCKLPFIVTMYKLSLFYAFTVTLLLPDHVSPPISKQ